MVGNYKLTDRILGQGSFSRVLLAYTAQKRKVAVKVIPRTEISCTSYPIQLRNQ
jgi:serine/threonine protein kinase